MCEFRLVLTGFRQVLDSKPTRYAHVRSWLDGRLVRLERRMSGRMADRRQLQGIATQGLAVYAGYRF
jgi:hypothetical protein